jgi:NAD(P)-dependent dehydrogenase (short-subunit alcohol dehydrogenase family)
MSEHPDHEEPETDAAGAPRLAGVPLEKRRAIVVGASSGIGAALVERLAREGYRVAALARRGGALDELATRLAPTCARTGGAVLTAAHDVYHVAETDALFELLVRELGGLDLLIYAAGIMPEVAADQYDTGLDLDILAVNTGGCIAWCNPTAELFLSQRSGTIVGIASIAGDRGRRGNPAYGTSKAAMSHYLEALRNRLGEYGVHVCTIRPGYVDTVMTSRLPNPF